LLIAFLSFFGVWELMGESRGDDFGGRNAGKQQVAFAHGFGGVVCPQGHSDTLLLVAVVVQREMTPPGAIVVPKVVEGIGCVDTDGQLDALFFGRIIHDV